MFKKSTFLISPVRLADEKVTRRLERIVAHLERNGWEVHWPIRDTDQRDLDGGWSVCRQNLGAIMRADAVHLVLDETSTGSRFDLGMCFALGKKVIPLVMPPLTSNGKSIQNVVWKEYQMHLAHEAKMRN